MRKGLNAVCYEQEMHIYFERGTSLAEEDFLPFEAEVSSVAVISLRNGWKKVR